MLAFSGHLIRTIADWSSPRPRIQFQSNRPWHERTESILAQIIVERFGFNCKSYLWSIGQSSLISSSVHQKENKCARTSSWTIRPTNVFYNFFAFFDKLVSQDSPAQPFFIERVPYFSPVGIVRYKSRAIFTQDHHSSTRAPTENFKSK